MKTTLIRTLTAIAAVAAFSTAAHAAGETPLGTTLGGISNWTLKGDNTSFSFDGLAAGTGSTLTFVFQGETTWWADSQTFAITDGTVSHQIFAGADTAASAPVSYTVSSLFNGVKFDSHSNDSQQFSPGGADADYLVYQSNTNANLYALAYEDYHYGSFNDHNDMVIEMTVAAVPEPETYALMLVGLLSVGYIARRRNRV